MTDEKLDEIIVLLKSVCSSIQHDYSFEIKESIVRGIDNAINGHRGTLDREDMDRMREEKRNDELVQKQIAALSVQTEESRKQTKQIIRQTKYIISAFIVTVIASIASIWFSAQ